ncbi:YDG domain-containing protein [uncultured Selenomonas sp.]|uniref:YDG domain-containing protein n=1 Tax=uncultured Selenomonas sp. TaxID=159275 RepID=UPI0026757B1B|nr:YDG domain-containing protein [uncultured Selenomonas sp.]
MGKYRTRELTQRVRYALLAGVAGAFLIPQVAAAAPTGEHDYTAGVTVGRAATAAGTDTNITATAPNNVIKWADYSVKQGEKVEYDGKNYLNIVTGGNTSAINGTIKNTGGDIYLVNPNGVIFGKTASVNVGNLYVSTQEESTLNTTAFTGSGASPLSTSAGDVGKADVVNMGSITANKVEVYGRSIRILDAAKVHDATTSPVVLHTDTAANGGYAHVGYKSGAEPAATAYKVNGANAVSADNYYQLVSTPTQFQNINNDLTKNYMLANDIDFYDAVAGTKKSLTPIGGDTHAAFSGKFDGNFFRIQNFTVSGTSRAGAFGEINGARIDNLGVTGAEVTGVVNSTSYAGGIAAYTAGNTTLNNVYVDRTTTVSGANGRHGGIVGYTTDTTIDSAYSKATIGAGGGIVGYSAGGTTINNTYSDVITTDTSPSPPNTPAGAAFIYYMNPSAGTHVNNSYHIGGRFSYSSITSAIKKTYTINKGTGKVTELLPSSGGFTPEGANAPSGYSVDTYAAWGNTINNTGAPGAKWRIYEGRTLPLLTAFMDGTATATYDTRYFNANGTLNTESANTAKSNKGADIETTYNSQYVKIVGKDAVTGDTVVGGKSNVVTYAGAMQYNADGTPNLDHIYDYVSAGTNDFDKTNGIRNAGTKAILWSDQDGPNLRGVNVTVKQREVKLDGDSIEAKRMYNGKSDVTDAFIQALSSGNIKSNGFTAEDVASGSVRLDFTTGGFKAVMVKNGTLPATGANIDKNVGTDKPVKFTGSISFSGDDAANYYFNNASLSSVEGKATITKAPLYLKINKTTADAKIYDGTDAVLDLAMKQTGTTTPNITLNKDNYAPASTVTSPTHHKGEIMLDDGDNPDDVDLTQVTDPTYTDTTGAKQIHVGDHNLQYKNVGLRGADAGNYDLYLPPIPSVGNGNKVVGNTVYLAGEIIRREITRDSFKVYDSATNAEVTAQKVYDGNATYTPGGSVYLSTNAPASGNVGIVTRDQGHITFALTGGTGTFKDAAGANSTKNVAEARKIAYNVTGVADTGTDADGIGYKLEDYYVLDADGVTKHSLRSAFDATGQGRITPKALTATVVNNHITKVYDAKQNQTDGNRNDIIGDALVTLSGFVSGETRTNTSTAMYASPNVAWDNAANAPTSQAVTYTAKFDRGTGAEADNYTLDPTAHTTTVTNSASVSGSYTGTITPRDLKLTFGDVTKVYDGTADNATKNVTALDDGLSGAVTTADGTTAAGISAAALSSATSSYGDSSGTTFKANRNAGSRVVEYVGLAGALGTNHNYAIADKQYGKGEITRRRIDPSGFQVRKADGTIANASKGYDGTDLSDLPTGASLVTPTATSGNTGIVAHDAGKITFKLKDGSHGYFSSDRDGNNRTSHVSEAHYVAYDIVAHTDDDTNNPLSNYTFGSATATTLKNLEDVNNTNPAHVTADGSITPAALHAQTHSIEKVYDGLAAHTDGNRAAVADKDTIITFTGWVTHNGITEKRTNNSSAVYLGFGGGQGKDVAYDAITGDITTKNVTYTAALTGNYADDYKIVDITGAGAATATAGVTTTVADAGKITPRALKIVMNDVSKTYDGNAKNTTVSVKEITDTIGSAVIDDILSDDNVTALDLTNQYLAKMAAAPANYKSTYGRGNTDATFAENVNASNGTPHDVQYTNMREAFRTKFGSPSAGNYSVEKNVYGKGTINRRNIDPNRFDVVDDHNVTSHATKEYDGTTTYNVPTGWKLNPSSGPSTGVIAGDDVTFHLTSDGAQFTTAAHNPTPNAYDADKVMYNVVASGDREKIKNYTLGGRKLEDGKAKVYGEGKITRRVLSLALVNNTDINKVYDGQTGVVDTDAKHWKALTKTDAKGNVAYTTGSKELVNDGSSFHIEANYRNSANTANDKNVAYNSATPRNIIDKAIEYNIYITGGDARNYAFANGTPTPTNAENGLKLSATGKITPKDLSGAFKKITKVYDGTTSVDPTKVEFKTGTDGVLSGDTVNLATHTESFQSENVNGDGTTQVIDGTPQKNWINYSNLSLGGAQAGNYTIASTAKGLGEITPYVLNPTSVDFSITQASKTYDGTKTVKWTDGSSAPSDQKKYITSATVNINGNHVNVLNDLEVTSAEYDTKNVDSGRSANRVTYNLSYTGQSGNFSLGGASTFAKKYNGVITKKDVTVTVKSPLTKTYDATTGVLGVAKNSANAVVNTANDIIGMTGLVSGDGATNATTATFDNKNVGTNKNVIYDIKLDTASAGNYNLKYNGAAITAPISTNNNTITKRKVDVTFAPVTKSYDGTPTNTSITPSVSAANAAVLQRDSSAHVSGTNLTGLTGITSQYGTGTTDGTFTPDANAGTNKSVQYAGIGTAMGTAFGANNYEFATNGYGKGTITKANINASDVTFAASNAAKVYDGTKTVKYNGSSASNDVKNYITTASVVLNGNTVDLRNDLVMDTTGTQYSSANATNGTPATVTYKFYLNNSNINISGDNNFTKTAQGTIDRRVLTLDLAQKTGINKIYDANANLVDTDTRHYDKFIDDDAKGNVTYASGTTNDNKLVRTANGAAVDDGASMTITANYANAGVADKNAGVNKDIAYNVKIGGAQGQNYTLSYNGTTANAETGLDLTGASGTIAKRKITLGFGDVSKPYDTTPNNNTKNITSVTAGNTDGRGAATLTADGITSASFDTTGIVSYYGAGTTDATFQRNPNVVTDANGNVIPNGKDVQYSNLANTLAAQPYAANYEITNTAYGKGTIRKRTVTANDFTFNINNATKMYDGTNDVYWKDTVTGESYKDMEHVKNYFSTSKLDLGGGNLVDINLNDIQLNSAQYNDYRVAHAAGVDYDVTINTQNFEFSGTRNRIINHTGDKIEKRDLATKLPPHLIKEYDGEDTFTETNEIFANAMARANLTGVVDRDKNKIQLKVKGTYSSPDASVETRADAEARTPATAGRDVAYELTLSGDADTLSNYKIGTVETLDSNGEMKGNGSGKADIYKKTLTISADPIDKVYDGTRTVVRPNGSTTAPHPAANKLKLNGFAKSADHFDFDQTAADKIDGLYSDPNVSRAADGTILDKDIAYSGVKAAFKNYADNHAGSAARNYRVDSDTVSGKGKITPRTITPNDIANGLTLADATKVYDGTTKVKYNGQNTPDALKNYLTSATVNINGTPIDIKKELTIRTDEASTHYDTANVAGGAQPRVTYTLNYTGHNFDIAGPITKQANGVITKRQVTAYAPGQLTKEYDGTPKVYDSGDPTIKTYYRGNQVTSGADIVQLEEENGDRGLLTNDGVQNISTATFEDKKAGRNKKVNYNIAVDAAHAGNYELVDQRGNVISQTSTNNNTITPRRLDITFGDVSRAYDGTSTNTDVTALVKDSDARATLRRDGVNPSGEQLILRDPSNNDITLPSDYGYGRTDSAFTKNADANQTGEPPKDVQYRKLGDAMRTLLGNDAGNYDFDETGYGKGRITKASVRESDFRMKFKDAVKEYDGTDAVNDARSRLDRSDSRMHLPRTAPWKPFALQDKDIADIKGTYQPTGGKRSKDASENSRGVQYEVQLSKQNFDFENGWNGKIHGDGAGKINRRAITAETLPYLTKEYDGTRSVVNAARDADGNLITQSGDGLMRFRHANDAAKRALITGDDVSNATTATYDTENVAWKDGVWNQGNGTTADVGVAYALALSGADAANYKIVDSKGDEVTNAKGLGKITPKEIVLKADPQERWINEGLPTSYTGTPQGTNLSHNEVPEIVPDEKLPGTIDYSSPNARLRVGHYAVNGTYHAPNGAKDGDVVSRNYRFIQDPANDTALYIGPYIPDYEYYKAMTQVSKMTPDEYAYENASLDRTNHYSRKPTAQVDPVPPAVNVMRDGKDITRSDINVLDDTVYTIVDEVFG